MTVRLSTAATTVPGAGKGAAPVTLTDTDPPAGTAVASRVSRSRCAVGMATKALVAFAADATDPGRAVVVIAAPAMIAPNRAPERSRRKRM